MARYEKEIEAKQRVIAQLTQANREFETLCLNGVVGDQEGELVKLRNENVELRARVEELEKELEGVKEENLHLLGTLDSKHMGYAAKTDESLEDQCIRLTKERDDLSMLAMRFDLTE